MRGIVTTILFIIGCVVNAQSLSDIKYIELGSEIADSMILLNKIDVNKINKTFYEKQKLDSLKEIKDSIIKTLEIKNSFLDSIVLEQKAIIQNEMQIRNQLEIKFTGDLEFYKKELKKEKRKKICGQTTTGVCTIIIIALLL